MPDPNAPRQKLPKDARLLSSAEFDAVFDQKNSAADGRLVVYGAANPQGNARLGLVVSRRVGNAVRRNRWKRLLREAFRLSRAELPPMDLLCLPRGAAPPSLVDLTKSLKHLARRVARKAAKRDSEQQSPTQSGAPE